MTCQRNFQGCHLYCPPIQFPLATCGYFKIIRIKFLKKTLKFLSLSSSCLTSDYHTGQHRYRSFASSQEVLLDSAGLNHFLIWLIPSRLHLVFCAVSVCRVLEDVVALGEEHVLAASACCGGVEQWFVQLEEKH